MPLTRVGKLTLIGVVVVATEIPVFTIGYSEWNKCNKSSDYRKWCFQNRRYIVDFYYLTLDISGHHFQKDKDLKEWGIQDPKDRIKPY